MMWWEDRLREIVMTGRVPEQELEHAVWALYAALHTDAPPAGVCRLPLTQGKWALVDATDLDWLMQWEWCAAQCRDGSWVAQRGGEGATLLHQAILPVEPPLIVDHVNGDRLDCRRSNLRAATHSQNGANSKRKGKQPHGFKGIYLDADRAARAHEKPWVATIKVNYKSKFLGRYATPEEAARAYDAAAVQHFGDFARLNFQLERR